MESEIRFQPFIGKYFEREESIFKEKILILGESHVIDDYDPNSPLNKTFTQEVLKEVIYNYEGLGWQQTFLCFERALVGKELEQKEREYLWNSLMFYNYVQQAVPVARTTIPEEYLESSEKALQEVLLTYQPDKIIFWGDKLCGILPDWCKYDGEITLEEGNAELFNFEIGERKIPAMKVHHPSSPSDKRWDYWHNFHKQFLNDEYLKRITEINWYRI